MVREIYKFGGASVKDADAVRNLKNIVGKHKNDDILLVVSAMGKTTNKLEKALETFRNSDGSLGIDALADVIGYHEGILLDLFGSDGTHPVFEEVSKLFLELYEKLCERGLNYDFHYDQTVCYGELISTTIISEYLNQNDIPARWLDARKYVVTDTCFRSAVPNWDETRLRISRLNDEHINGIVCVTQGFIGSAAEGRHTTTLGREGSDFTAAIFANCLEAEKVTIWKDVDGVLNADPKRFAVTRKIDHLSYSEAVELAFYGATVIHPKTIKPLQNKNIVLNVQSFVNPQLPPTVIDCNPMTGDLVPSYIVKDNQTLVSLNSRDFSFMSERNLHVIFDVCAQLGIHANMVQTSALSLSLCFDHDPHKLESLVLSLTNDFSILYNDGLQLFTIRHYKAGLEEPFASSRKVYLKQLSRSTLQLVLEKQ